jgi:hypothetical protein
MDTSRADLLARILGDVPDGRDVTTNLALLVPSLRANQARLGCSARNDEYQVA